MSEMRRTSGLGRWRRGPIEGLGPLAVCVAVGLVLVACGGTASAASSTRARTVDTSSSNAASGCGTSAPPGSSTLSLKVDGRRRVVIVHVPNTYKDHKKTPLVLNMHGSGSTALAQEGFTAMDATADAHDFIVAYPQGIIAEGTGYDWNVPNEPLIGGKSVPAGAANDVTFLTDLVGVLEHRYCVDAKRVYATGFSGGARMASQLACDSAKVFAAVAPVSGLRRPTPCRPSRAVPVISFHGTADPIDPYEGHGQAYWTYSVPQAAADWGRQDGCKGSAVVTHPVATVTLTEYRSCRQGAVVKLYTIAGEGHEWPGGPHLGKALTRLLGPQSTAINADDVMWAFFAAHPMT